MKIRFIFAMLMASLLAVAQGTDWQQHVSYKMDIDFDEEQHRFSGSQELTYINNSPDDLEVVYYHLYFNAFQPMSMMDVRQRSLPDPDKRMGSRILHLEENEIGYHHILDMTQDGKKLKYEVKETILVVYLDHAIKAGKKSVLKMNFESQVPIQIRRSGRDNKEGIDYSMAQWYPKLAEYDYDGWHADPYIAREFHGVWGDFDVQIEMDSAYTVAATGKLQNPSEIGKGYGEQHSKYAKNDRLNWHFKAENVHDFAWAADRDYEHDILEMENGPVFHFFYEGGDSTITDHWKKLPKYAEQCVEIMHRDYGVYPYEQYSVVQGGDGGMEYPMLTLISGEGSMPGLMSVTIHEFIHSWYQGVLGSNEQMFPWLDEGFTQYVQARVMSEMRGGTVDDKMKGLYSYYSDYAKSDKHEPMSLFSDYYATNKAYGANAYTKGAIFLHQLTYIIGEEAFLRGMKTYYSEWQFKHPEPRDFKHIMERESGIKLDWYLNQWLETTHNVDYSVEAVENRQITLKNNGRIPMPVELCVTTTDSIEHWYYIPLLIMWGEKDSETYAGEWEVKNDWPWVFPEYSLQIPFDRDEILSVEIDPSIRMADVNREDNSWPIKEDSSFQRSSEVE